MRIGQKVRDCLLLIFFLCSVSFSAVFAELRATDQTGNRGVVSQGSSKGSSDQVMPLEFFIEPIRTSVLVGDKVEVDLVVKNISAFHLQVQDIDESSTQCSFNEMNWGGESSTTSTIAVLAPGESLRKKLRFVIFEPGPLNVHCSYGVGVNGIRPSAKTVIDIRQE